MTDWMKTNEAAQFLRVHRITLLKWAQGGHVPATKVGKLWRFSRAELDAWMKDPVRRLHLVPTDSPDRLRPVDEAAARRLPGHPTTPPRGGL